MNSRLHVYCRWEEAVDSTTCPMRNVKRISCVDKYSFKTSENIDDIEFHNPNSLFCSLAL